VKSFDKYDKLIYDLVFSKEEKFKIDIHEYVDDIYKYEDFIFSIKEILRKSKVSILYSTIDVNSKSVQWELKIRK
jgi:hypothetical protein